MRDIIGRLEWFGVGVNRMHCHRIPSSDYHKSFYSPIVALLISPECIVTELVD